METLEADATVAERIRFYRTKNNMTGDALAGLLGVSKHTIMYYENNQTEPSIDNLKDIANTLNVDVDKLFDDYFRFLNYPYPKMIKQIRDSHHLLQRELGMLLDLDRRTIERWESGQHVVSRKNWEKLKKLKLLL